MLAMATCLPNTLRSTSIKSYNSSIRLASRLILGNWNLVLSI